MPLIFIPFKSHTGPNSTFLFFLFHLFFFFQLAGRDLILVYSTLFNPTLLYPSLRRRMISWSNILILFSFISFNLAFNTTSQPSYFPHPHQIHSKFRRQSTSPSRPIHSVIKKRDLNGMGLQSILAINVPSPTPTSQSNSNLAAAKFTTQKEINHAKAGDGLELVSSQSIVPLGVQGAQTGLQTDFGNFFSTLPTQLKSSDSRFTTRSKLATVPLHSGTPPGAQTTTAATLSLSPARSTSTQMAPTQTPFISLTSPSISIPTAVPTSIATLFDSASIGSTFSNSAVAIASISAANVAK